MDVVFIMFVSIAVFSVTAVPLNLSGLKSTVARKAAEFQKERKQSWTLPNLNNKNTRISSPFSSSQTLNDNGKSNSSNRNPKKPATTTNSRKAKNTEKKIKKTPKTTFSHGTNSNKKVRHRKSHVKRYHRKRHPEKDQHMRKSLQHHKHKNGKASIKKTIKRSRDAKRHKPLVERKSSRIENVTKKDTLIATTPLDAFTTRSLGVNEKKLTLSSAVPNYRNGNVRGQIRSDMKNSDVPKNLSDSFESELQNLNSTTDDLVQKTSKENEIDSHNSTIVQNFRNPYKSNKSELQDTNSSMRKNLQYQKFKNIGDLQNILNSTLGAKKAADIRDYHVGNVDDESTTFNSSQNDTLKKENILNVTAYAIPSPPMTDRTTLTKSLLNHQANSVTSNSNLNASQNNKEVLLNNASINSRLSKVNATQNDGGYSNLNEQWLTNISLGNNNLYAFNKSQNNIYVDKNPSRNKRTGHNDAETKENDDSLKLTDNELNSSRGLSAIQNKTTVRFSDLERKSYGLNESPQSVNHDDLHNNRTNEFNSNDNSNNTAGTRNEHLQEKRECCHYYDHGHDLMEMHNNPHHYDGDFLNGGAHDEFHSVDEHGDRFDYGTEPVPSYFIGSHHGGAGGHYRHGGGGYEHGGGHMGGGYEHGGGHMGGGYGDGSYGAIGGIEHHDHQYNNVHNEPHYHQHFHHYTPHFEHNDYHYIDDHHEHYHHQPHYINNEVHIHHDRVHHEPMEEHHGSGDYHHGRFHHVKVNLHGPGKSPSQWAHQEHAESNEMDHYGEDEEASNYDTGAGFFELEEHGGEVDITSLHKSGTKVHMGGGAFSVIRDPWRYHSAFAGLFHPHETMGASLGGGGGVGGGMGVQQFHQHFTYINNERNEKTKVQNLVHHMHEGGEPTHSEHHYSEHHDDHHLHHDHEHKGHHNDIHGGDHDDHHDDDHHHHHHEEDEDHHHYEEHHADSLHGPEGGAGGGFGGGGGGGGGYGGGTSAGAMGAGNNFAYARSHSSNNNDGKEQEWSERSDYKLFPGPLLNGEKQASGTPARDNYRTDRAPSLVPSKRTVEQITPNDAPKALGTNTTTGSKRSSTNNTDTLEELKIDDDIPAALTFDENPEIVKKIYFNNLIHDRNGGSKDDIKNGVTGRNGIADKFDADMDEKGDDIDKEFKDAVEEQVASGSGKQMLMFDGEKENKPGSPENTSESVKRKTVDSNGKEEISGNGLIGPNNLHLAEITRVFIEPMIAKKNAIPTHIEKKEYQPSASNKNENSSEDIATSSRKFELFKKIFLHKHKS